MKLEIQEKGFMMESIATILIIEDDADILELETFHLQKEGYKVIGVSSTHKVEELLKKEGINLMLVDRMLPRVDGSEYVRYLREKGVNTPVMFVSAKDEDEEVEEGFMAGCDDYLRKPFNIKELIYRVKAILRRTSQIEYERVFARDIVMDFNTRKTYINEEEVGLTKLEFELLSLFITHKNRALNREYLLEHIWESYPDTQKRTVNVTINRLRKKIDPEDIKNYITPIRGIGYKFQ